MTDTEQKKSRIEIKVFGLPSCPLCKKAIEKYEFFINHWKLKEKVKITYYDMSSLDGLTEGTFYEVVETPTTIFEKNNREIARFKKIIPISKEFKSLLET